MQEFTLIKYLKTTSGSNFKFKRTVQLPGTPQIECGIKLKDDSFFLVRCLTFCEDGRIFVLVSDDPLISDQELKARIKEYEQDGWTLSDHENTN